MHTVNELHLAVNLSLITAAVVLISGADEAFCLLLVSEPAISKFCLFVILLIYLFL